MRIIMSQTTLQTQYLQLAQASYTPSLRSGEKILKAGMAMIPPAFWAYLLFISSLVKTAQTYLVIVTNQRLVLARTKSVLGKYTPDTIIISREYERSAIAGAVIQGNAAVIQTSQGQLKLAGRFMTAPEFLSELANELSQTFLL
jgi:hypothetical protein